MTRPTISDLAKAAGVSISTVNRVLGGGRNVREPTIRLVQEAAGKIGFYGLSAIRAHALAKKDKFHFGFLLHQPSRLIYRVLGATLAKAAGNVEDYDVSVRVEYAEDLAPQVLAARLRELGETCQAVGVVAAVHPLVSQAIDALEAKGVPVFALISQLSAKGNTNYVGLDNWKVGRTAAWFVHNLSSKPGKVGILVGNHRYRCQEMNESGFRSYFREHAPEFTLLEPLSTFETSAIAGEMTEKLLTEHPDIKALYVAGGGLSGAINALRSCGASGRIITIGYQLLDYTQAGLLDGTITALFSIPFERMADETITGMIRAVKMGASAGRQTVMLPFEIYTRENV